MKQQSPTRPTAEIEPVLMADSNAEETDPGSDNDEVYSDELLDEFMRSNDADDLADSDDFGFGGQSMSLGLDGDDDFDSFFRDADGYSHTRRQRKHRGRDRHARESFEFESYDRSDWRAYNQRRPRR